MARRGRPPVTVRNYFEYKGRVLPVEAFTPEDRQKATVLATLPMMRVMNPDWKIELKPEAYEIDLEGYFRDAPTVGSLYATKEAQERIDAMYAKGV